MSELVLASASPRRRDLLRQIGVSPIVSPVDVDESRLDGEPAKTYVERIARTKLEAALARHPRSVVLVADTVVSFGPDAPPLTKPTSESEALRMIGELTGASHEVRTCIGAGREGSVIAVETITTTVHMRDASTQECQAYVATGEGADKAGGYGIQGIAGGFVTHIEGSYSNVVGLPLAETVLLLRRAGLLSTWPKM